VAENGRLEVKVLREIEGRALYAYKRKDRASF
jgi:hypothetical protein